MHRLVNKRLWYCETRFVYSRLYHFSTPKQRHSDQTRGNSKPFILDNFTSAQFAYPRVYVTWLLVTSHHYFATLVGGVIGWLDHYKGAYSRRCRYIFCFIMSISTIFLAEKWNDVMWSVVMWGELTRFMWSDLIWSEVKWVNVKFL